MNKTDVKKRIEKLKKEINRHRYLYHVMDRQEISDAALDSLKKELFDLEMEFPKLITSDSPTQRIGGKPLPQFKKVRHKVRMTSFNDAFTKEDMEKWEERMHRYLKEEVKFDYYCEPKIDGLAVSLTYRNGIFSMGSTRGDGIIGEDITQNLKTINDIPLKINLIGDEIKNKRLNENHKKIAIEKAERILKKININDSEIEVRGEIFLEKKEFEDLNIKRKKKGNAAYANPRNVAAGSIRQLDPKVAASRNLRCFIYDIVTPFGYKTHEEEHIILRELGFRTNPHTQYSKNLDDVFNYYNNWIEKRDELNYEIDGVVVIVNDNKLFDKLGVVGKAPRGGIALKFPGMEAVTKVLNIKVQVGRTGALTPVAVLKPVNVGGVTVSHASLHNEDEIRRLGVKIGDTVVVQRAGDVIPDVVRVLPGLRTGKEKAFLMPNKCPVCGYPTKKPEGGVAIYCTNEDCFAQIRRKVAYFISKPAFNIEGLGPKIINQLFENSIISDPADLFSLTEGDLIPLERFADKSAKNLISSINSRKKIDLARFILALGIRHVGEETARDLASHFGNLDNIKNASQDDINNILNIGEIVAKSTFDYFKDKKNLNLIDKLIKNGVEIIPEKAKKRKGKLIGKSFIITGTLSTMFRQDAKDKIRELGGKIVSSASGKTDYLIAGRKPGSKLDKAKKLGIKILSEREFISLLK